MQAPMSAEGNRIEAPIVAAPARAGSRAAAAIGLCIGIAALEGYDIQAVGVAAPTMAPALHMPEAFIGYAGSISMAGLILGSVIGGWFADRVGRKPVLAFSAAWFGVFSILTARVGSGDMLLLLRLLTGLGFGGAMPNLIAVATELSRPERRTRTVALIFAGMPAGGAVASLITLAMLSGLLPKSFDWRLIYLVGGVVPLLLAPLAIWLLPETRPDHAGERRDAMTVLFGEKRLATTLLMWVAFAFTLVILYLLVGWLPTLVVAEGLSRTDGVLAALSFNLFSTVGGVIVGGLVDRHGLRRPMAASYLGLVVAMSGLALATSLPLILLCAGLAGFFAIGAQFSLYGASPIYYPAAARALGVGAAVGAGRLGSIAGPSLASALRSAHAPTPVVIGVTLPVILIAATAAIALSFVGRVDPES